MIYLGLFLVVFMVFTVLRVPIPFSMCIGAMVTMAASGMKLAITPSAVFSAIADHFAFLAVPAFIYAGELMTSGGVSRSLLSFIGLLLGRIRGSLGAVAVITSALFGTITGSSLATISAIGGIMIPEMTRSGYSKPYTTALIAASGFLGILIPPSVPGVIYAITAGLPVIDVWVATIGPGILLSVMYIIVNYLFFGCRQKLESQSLDLKKYGGDLARSLPRTLVAVMMPVIIFVGVYGGIFTPTEAGAVAVLYGIIAGWVIFPLLFKDRPEEGFWTTTKKSAVTSAAIMMVIAFASVVSQMVAYTGICQMLVEFFTRITDSQAVFLLIVNIFLLIIGMFMETNTSILLFAPILIPVAKAFQVDPVHFSAIMLLNLEIGMITPPFAVNLFTACRMSGISMDRVVRPLFPFLLVCLITLLVTTYYPDLSLFTVKLLK